MHNVPNITQRRMADVEDLALSALSIVCHLAALSPAEYGFEGRQAEFQTLLFTSHSNKTLLIGSQQQIMAYSQLTRDRSRTETEHLVKMLRRWPDTDISQCLETVKCQGLFHLYHTHGKDSEVLFDPLPYFVEIQDREDVVWLYMEEFCLMGHELAWCKRHMSNNGLMYALVFGHITNAPKTLQFYTAHFGGLALLYLMSHANLLHHLNSQAFMLQYFDPAVPVNFNRGDGSLDYPWEMFLYSLSWLCDHMHQCNWVHEFAILLKANIDDVHDVFNRWE